jgi:hypothetical protein
MNFIVKNKLITGILLFLLLLNISMAVTIVLHLQKEAGIKTATSAGNNQMFLCRQLGFSEIQQAEYQKHRSVFMSSSDSIRTQMNAIRQQMAEELQNQHPDVQTIRELSAKAGQLHGMLTFITARHFQSTGLLCTPEQKTKLIETYRTTGLKEAGSQGGGKQYRHRYGRGGK